NGRRVQTFKIGRSVIFPTKTGILTVQPFKTSIVCNLPRRVFPKQLDVESNAINIKVLPFPQEGRPSYFDNAVGKYSISATLKADSVQMGNVIELDVRVSGYGNLQNVNAPLLQLPASCAFYGDTETKNKFSFSSIGAKGAKIFTYFIQCNQV